MSQSELLKLEKEIFGLIEDFDTRRENLLASGKPMDDEAIMKLTQWIEEGERRLSVVHRESFAEDGLFENPFFLLAVKELLAEDPFFFHPEKREEADREFLRNLGIDPDSNPRLVSKRHA